MKAYPLLTLVLLLLSACNIFGPVEPSLPPETQQGADTFGALVDGVVWRPRYGDLSRPPLSASFSGGTLYLKATDRVSDSGFSFELYDTIYSEATYQLIHIPKKFYVQFSRNNIVYRPTIIHNGYLVITRLDTVHTGFVSGTFYFDAVNENDSTDIIHITEGRFDVRF